MVGDSNIAGKIHFRGSPYQKFVIFPPPLVGKGADGLVRQRCTAHGTTMPVCRCSFYGIYNN